MNKSILKMRKELTKDYINRKYSKVLNRIQVPVFVVFASISILTGIRTHNIPVMGASLILSGIIAKLVRGLHAQYIYKAKSKNPKWVRMYDLEIEKLMLAKLKSNNISKDFYDCYFAAEKYSSKNMSERLERLSPKEKMAVNKMVKNKATIK